MGQFIFAIAWLLVEGLGLPLLSELAFGALVLAVNNQVVTMPVAFLTAWLATCIGNGFGYFIFYRYGPTLIDRLGRRWPALERRRAEIEPKVRVQLFLAVTVARFVGMGTFQLVLWFAGAFRTDWRRLLPYLFVLNFFWTAAWLFGSKWLVKQVLRVLEGKTPTQIVLMAIAAVLVMWLLHHLVTWVQRLYKQRQQSQ